MTVLDRVSLKAINVRVNYLHIGRMLAATVAAVFYLVGWLPATAVRTSVRAAVWCAAAVVVGWSEGMARQDSGRT